MLFNEERHGANVLFHTVIADITVMSVIEGTRDGLDIKS